MYEQLTVVRMYLAFATRLFNSTRKEPRPRIGAIVSVERKIVFRLGQWIVRCRIDVTQAFGTAGSQPSATALATVTSVVNVKVSSAQERLSTKSLNELHGWESARLRA